MRVQLSARDEHEAKTKSQDTMALVRLMGSVPRNENMGGVSREMGTLQGFRTEYAVARVLGLEPPNVNIESDGGIDLWAGSVSIDVKSTGKEDVYLIFDDFEKFGADIAVLVKFYLGHKALDILGWISRKEFLKKAHDHNFGFGDRKVMRAGDLHPIEKLWRFLKIKELQVEE